MEEKVEKTINSMEIKCYTESGREVYPAFIGMALNMDYTTINNIRNIEHLDNLGINILIEALSNNIKMLELIKEYNMTIKQARAEVFGTNIIKVIKEYEED